MKNSKLLVGTALVVSALSAQASHGSAFESIDSIDATFGAGGGFWSGQLANGTDDAWLVFSATAGDTVTITINAPAYKNAVLLRDSVDGVFAVGDALDVHDFNQNHVGDGTDLKILSHIGGLAFGGTATLTWVATYSGQYGIAIGAANDDAVWASGPMTVDVTGTTGNNVPEPSTLAIAGLGLLGLAGSRRIKR